MHTLRFFTKTFIFFIAVNLLLFTSACSDDMANREGSDQPVEFLFTQSPVETRTITGEDGSGSFADGDKIDLYAHSASATKHFLLTMENGQWKPQILRGQLGEGDVTLTGYYPATEPAQSPGTEYHHAISADQSSEEAFRASDLLCGSAQISGEKTLVQMRFAHSMHRLRINVTPQAGNSLPSDLKVEVLSKRYGTVTEKGATIKDTEAEWVTAHAMTTGWAAILFPQETEPYKQQGWIRLSTGGKSSQFELPEAINGKPFTRFEAGKEVTVNLTLTSQGGGNEGTYTLTFDSNGGTGKIPPIHLKPGEVTILPDGAEYFTKTNSKFAGWNSSPEKEGIIEWRSGRNFTMPDHDMTIYAVWHLVDDNIGGASEEFKGTTQWMKGITPPAAGDWKQVKNWNVTDGLEGKTVPVRPEYGWYDVSQGNQSMCWAACASDILHYWMDRNQQYLDRYGYKGPRTYEHKTGGSQIFDDFMKHWGNSNGGFARRGFYWYLVGNSTQEGGGYFKDVFDGKVEIESVGPSKGRKAVSRKAFTEIITKAFKRDMTISMVMPFLSRTHQYIIWGVQYNDEGYVSGVYYVNPNDFGQKVAGTEEQIGLLYMDILYLDDGGTYVSSSIPGSYLPILSMEVCGIGQDVWEEYFRTHPDK